MKHSESGAPALFELHKVLDNPQFEGFGFVREESLCGGGRIEWDFGPRNRKTLGRASTVPRLAPIWTPQHVVGRVRAFNDYPCVNMIIPAFSRRAADTLHDLLEPNGELLPLVSSLGQYCAYNITTIADILDEERSEFGWLSDNHTIDQIFDIERYECYADRMDGLSIFHLLEKPSSAFVSQVFVDRVVQSKLHGFRFVKLWPLPKGVSWREQDRKERDKIRQIEKKRGIKPVKGNGIVLCLSTARARPNKAESKRLQQVMDDLDTLLHDATAGPNALYYGSLEGHEPAEGSFRLFLSCPDADVLVDRLRPWLAKLDWEAPIRVLKRYGEYVDPDCREEWVDLDG